MAGDGPPPAALLAFLGEAPSEAALRRPTTGESRAAPSVRGHGEDSSPDTPDRAPVDNGGFDDFRDDACGPVPETEAVPSLGSTGNARSRRTPDRPPKVPGAAEGVVVGSPTGAGAYPSGSGPSAPPRQQRSPKRGNSGGSKSDLSKTSTPVPAALAEFLGSEPADAALRKSFGSTGGSGGTPKRANSERSNGSGSAVAAANAGRPRSGSRRAADAQERSQTPTQMKGALDMDPLNSSGNRRRFGGRG